jgi:hypothetical protein
VSRHALHTHTLLHAVVHYGIRLHVEGGGEGKGAASHLCEPSVWGEAGSQVPNNLHRSPLATPTHPLTPAGPLGNVASALCARVCCTQVPICCWLVVVVQEPWTWGCPEGR